MKSLLFAALFLVSIVCSPAAEPKEKFLLVKETDRSKKESYSLMSPDEYKAADTEIKAESRLHTKALAAAAKDWRADEDLSKKPFPTGAVSVRTIRVITTYTDSEKANEKLSYYMGKDAKAAEKRQTRDQANPPQNKKSPGAMEREQARAALDEQARQMYENKLSELAEGGGNLPKEAAPAAAAGE